jgi:hypothetical protein
MDHPDNFAIDHDGRPLPFSPTDVATIVKKAIDSGDLVLAVLMHDGDIMVQVFGPPSQQTAEILQQAAKAYGAMFKQA